MPAHWIICCCASLTGCVAMCRCLGLDAVAAWLIAVNVVTFLTYGYDKAVAGSGWRRVPERLLLALGLAGGTVGALAGMHSFRHKTAKGSFRLRFWAVVVLQLALAAAYFLWLRPMPGVGGG